MSDKDRFRVASYDEIYGEKPAEEKPAEEEPPVRPRRRQRPTPTKSDTVELPEERPVLIRVSDVQPEPIRWLWRGRIPRDMLTILDGDPDLGKSTITLDLAARITTSSPFPDRTAVEHPGPVLLLSAEDIIAKVIRPRLAAAGADMTKVTCLDAVTYREENGTTEERPPVLPGDLSLLEAAINRTAAVLVIIDPLSAYLSEKVDSHKDQHIRRALMPLSRLAERTGVAVVIVRHLNKDSGSNALYRGGGSIGIIGAARAGLLVAVDPDDDTRRVMAVTKANLAPKPPALAYRLVPDELHDCGRIVWEGATAHKANELLRVADTSAEDDTSDAVSALEAVLTGGPLWVKTALDAMRDAGFSKDQAKRAKAKRRVYSVKVGKPGDAEQGWQWVLPRRRNPEGSEGSEGLEESGGRG